MDCVMVPYKPYKQKTDAFGEADRMTAVKSLQTDKLNQFM